jgi:hypothetical protein
MALASASTLTKAVVAVLCALLILGTAARPGTCESDCKTECMHLGVQRQDNNFHLMQPPVQALVVGSLPLPLRSCIVWHLQG